MKRYVYLFVTLLFLSLSTKAQDGGERIQKLGAKLDSLVTVIPALSKPVEITINSTDLSTYLRAVANSHNMNLSIEPSLKSISVSQRLTDAKVKDVLLNLSKEHKLTIEAIGNILSVKRYIAPYVEREIPIFYNKAKNVFTADIQQDSLSVVARKITTVTGKNISFDVGLGNKVVSSFIKDMTLDAGIEKLASENKLKVRKTENDVYILEDPTKAALSARRGKSGGFYFKIKDTINQIIEVDFVDTPVENVINDIAYDLKINMATSKPLKNIGKATIKSDYISFDDLLARLLENTKFSYKLENGMYFFGESKLASIQNAELIILKNRSIELMMEPLESSGGFLNNQQIPNTFSQNGNYNNGIQGQQFQSNRGRSGSSSSRGEKKKTLDEESLKSIFPEEITDSLTVKIDTQHNGFVVMGDAQRIEKFKKFVKQIDTQIPLVLIEIMIIEVNKSTSVSAGIDLGIGDAPVEDKGTIFSGTDLTLGAKTINKVIGGLSFGSHNIGKVVPNFYARIQALETNGDLKIRSTPKLTALNGHVASSSNGERVYYTQTLVNTIGSQNPQTNEYVNYVPIDANLSIKIRPFVSGNGSITLSIDVQQSSFNSNAVPEGAPPGVNTRKFTSTVVANNEDVVILGGMEIDSKSNSGSGVPFLARIPVIKWLFSKRVRTAQKSKLSVLIKPTILRGYEK